MGPGPVWPAPIHIKVASEHRDKGKRVRSMEPSLSPGCQAPLAKPEGTGDRQDMALGLNLYVQHPNL